MIDIVNKDYLLVKKAALIIFKRPSVEKTARNIFDNLMTRMVQAQPCNIKNLSSS